MSATGVIVISSPAEQQPTIYTPRPRQAVTDRLLGLSPHYSSPLTPPSPSELFRTSSRSKYFQTDSPVRGPQEKTKTGPKKGNKKDLETRRTKDGAAKDKPKRGRKKTVTEQRDASEDSRPDIPAPEKKAIEKSTKTKKSRTSTTGKRAESGNKTITGRVAKPGGARGKEAEKKTAAPSTTPTEEKEDATKARNWDEDGLHLEEAVKRRSDWTPPKDTSKPDTELNNEESFENTESTDVPGFGGLLSTYNFSGKTSPPRSNIEIAATEDNGPTKRRRIELVTSRALPGSVGKPSGMEDSAHQTAKKPKKQAKKMNTLTARVTARYVADDIEDLEVPESHKPTRQRQTKAKAKEPQFTVLSPEAATKAINEQDLVFGTCSQLEREDSPTTLRDMQMAIRASESSTSQGHRSRESPGLSTKPGVSAESRLTAPRNLWSVAARDLDGSLVDAEVLDMVDVDICQVPSRTDKAPTKPREKDNVDSATESLTKETTTASETPAICPQPKANNVHTVRESSPPKSQPPMPHYAGFTEAELRQQVSAYGFKPLKSRKKMIDLLEKCWESRNGPIDKPEEGNSSSACATHAMEVHPPSKATGKKIQKTTKAKAISKSTTQTQEDIIPTATTTNSQLTTPSKRRAPPKPTAKAQAATKQQLPQRVDEIEDSENELIPSPSRLQTRYTASLSLSPSKPGTKRQAKAKGKSADTTQLPISTNPASTPQRSSRKCSLPDLETQITHAVRAQSQSQVAGFNRRNSPTWHEKILMYDPVVLEDFAAWLNTTGLGLVGEDKEIGPGIVREWCERKGVCCCWKRGDV